MNLKRVNVFLEEGTIFKLKEIADNVRHQEGGYYSLTASDLIRLAIEDYCKIETSARHYYDKEKLNKLIKRVSKKPGGK